MTTLPRTPSKLLRIALADLVKVERSKKYVIDMGAYHDIIPNYRRKDAGKCAVCLAGAIMARTLECDPNRDIDPSDFGHSTQYKLYAINDIQFGQIPDGLYHLGYASSTIAKIVGKIGKYRDIPSYDADPAAYKRAIRKLADDFETAGF